MVPLASSFLLTLHLGLILPIPRLGEGPDDAVDRVLSVLRSVRLFVHS